MDDLSTNEALKLWKDMAKAPKQTDAEAERQELLTRYEATHGALVGLLTKSDPSLDEIKRVGLIAAYGTQHTAFIGFLRDLTDRVADLEERLKKNGSDT